LPGRHDAHAAHHDRRGWSDDLGGGANHLIADDTVAVGGAAGRVHPLLAGVRRRAAAPGRKQAAQRVLGGRALGAVRSEVAEQKAKRQPVRISVQHHPKVLLVNATDGVVADEGINHSVVLDPSTGKPAEPDPNERFSEHRSFKFTGGTWKVVEIIEEQTP